MEAGVARGRRERGEEQGSEVILFFLFFSPLFLPHTTVKTHKD